MSESVFCVFQLVFLTSACDISEEVACCLSMLYVYSVTYTNDEVERRKKEKQRKLEERREEVT